jgi:hypothetical protein
MTGDSETVAIAALMVDDTTVKEGRVLVPAGNEIPLGGLVVICCSWLFAIFLGVNPVDHVAQYACLYPGLPSKKRNAGCVTAVATYCSSTGSTRDATLSDRYRCQSNKLDTYRLLSQSVFEFIAARHTYEFVA